MGRRVGGKAWYFTWGGGEGVSEEMALEHRPEGNKCGSLGEHPRGRKTCRAQGGQCGSTGMRRVGRVRGQGPGAGGIR